MKKKFLLPVILCFLFCKCKKGTDLMPATDRFSFDLNGVTYSDAGLGNFYPGKPYDFIEFNNPVNSGHVIHMNTNGISWMYRKPVNETGFWRDYAIPALNFNSTTPDPSGVFQYQSGSIAYSRKNFRNWKDFDFFTGQLHNHTCCDVAGTFSLTLVNKAGQIITITNGEFLKQNIILY